MLNSTSSRANASAFDALDDLDTYYEGDGRRIYVTPDGDFPSVTSILQPYVKEKIRPWREAVGEAKADRIAATAAARGQAIHDLAERYLRGDNSTIGHTRYNIATFKTIQPILDQIRTVHAVEIPLYSKYLKAAGRCDCIGEYALLSGTSFDAIIDFKTSINAKTRDMIDSYFMQTSAYSVMVEERTGLIIPKLVIIMAVDNDQPRVFTGHRDDYIGKFIELREQYEES